ncbi:MAG: hypothetical protein Q8R76_05460 [Candidatus Omnitrophota bacterium]|nr:hypothetical protein [Candidatus Omnitrophota bacterium]
MGIDRDRTFHYMGGFSAVCLIWTLILILPNLIRGDMESIRMIFQRYPGMEPFIIFFLPIIVVGGGAWIWRQIYNRQHTPGPEE